MTPARGVRLKWLSTFQSSFSAQLWYTDGVCAADLLRFWAARAL
jgi:hypothetical protein